MNLIRILSREAYSLSRESILNRMLRALGGHRFAHTDIDKVRHLRHAPLGMFFYNQRIIFYFFALIFIVLYYVIIHSKPKDSLSGKEHVQFVTLCSIWLIAFICNLYYHGHFRRTLKNWASRNLPTDLPPKFHHYFLFDFVILSLTIGIGYIFALDFEHLTTLLILNLAVYGAYVGRGRGYTYIGYALSIIVFAIIFFLFPRNDPYDSSSSLLRIYISLWPIIGALVFTIFTITIIYRLRSEEIEISNDRLSLMQKYKATVRDLIIRGDRSGEGIDKTSRVMDTFERVISNFLNDLCADDNRLWYRSACLWYRVRHIDRGELLVPGPHYAFHEAEKFKEGIDPHSGLYGKQSVVLLLSLKDTSEANPQSPPMFRKTSDAPAACIHLISGDKDYGVLALYGDEKGPSVRKYEESFLNHIGMFLTDAIELLNYCETLRAAEELDGLFGHASLGEVFKESARLLSIRLQSQGCMIIFRRDIAEAGFSVVASTGFEDIAEKLYYGLHDSLTGVCIREARALRIDNVRLHEDEFDKENLRLLRRSLRKEIRSWMAIPIGSGPGNIYGVIKIVNRIGDRYWFSDEDQRLAEKMAARISILIRMHLQSDNLREQADDAKRAKAIAIAESGKRQEDILVLSHQMVGALIPIKVKLSRILEWPLTDAARMKLTEAFELMTDVIIYSEGMYKTFALSQGKGIRIENTKVDVPLQVRLTCQRLQKSRDRHDLTFRYVIDPDFPNIDLDQGAFLSVLYSLIHNAMKYADSHTDVILRCKLDSASGKPVAIFSTIGLPIMPDETERIFEKFQQGKLVEDKGLRGEGVGLGLWVARELMRAMEGDITVEISQRNPRMSLFIIWLPNL